MAKNMVMRKYRDKVEIRGPNGALICDVVIADSSRTNSVNLSVQADKTFKINKVQQKTEAAG